MHLFISEDLDLRSGLARLGLRDEGSSTVIEKLAELAIPGLEAVGVWIGFGVEVRLRRGATADMVSSQNTRHVSTGGGASQEKS